MVLVINILTSLGYQHLEDPSAAGVRSGADDDGAADALVPHHAFGVVTEFCSIMPRRHRHHSAEHW